MVIRKSVSLIQNHFYDGQRIDQVDLVVEQDRNVNTDAAIIQNHFGSGILPIASDQETIFDTDNLYIDQVALIASNDFDGTGLRPLSQPTDFTLGNQLEVELKNSDVYGITTVGGRFSTKVLIIGLDFQGNLQYDRFYFYKQEKQVTKKHYAKVLSVFFNDFFGNNNCSRNLGGRVVIKETNSFQLSRDSIMISQDVEPNIFFRDFKISEVSEGNGGSTSTLYQAIQAGIGIEYDVDSLNINTTIKREIDLSTNDVTTRIAEKFIATSNNIQKITLLLGTRRNDEVSVVNRFDWSGELVVSVYELQTTVSCPSAIVPELAIEFEPNPVPITQFSLDQADFYDRGYVLTDTLQPIDFVFNNSVLGGTSKVIEGKIYVISIGRSGDASNGTLFTGTGNSQTINDRLSIFTGVWTDIPDEDLWYQVWTNTAKVSDGFGYDSGNGIEISKTNKNELGAVVDFAFDLNSFVDNGQNTINTAIIEAVLEQSQQEQDERTGNPVNARQKFEPTFSFVTNTTLETLRESSDPLIIGSARDTNAKNNNVIIGSQVFPGLVNTNTFTIINPIADILSQQLIGSKLIPNNNAGYSYKITNVSLCTDGYGDVNGDGVIDDDDVTRAGELLGQSLQLLTTQQSIQDGYFTTLEIIRADVDGDGYITNSDINLIRSYVYRNINSFPVGSTFTHAVLTLQNLTGRFDGYYDCGNNLIRLDGYSGNNTVNPSDLTESELIYYGYNGLPDLTIDTAYTTVPFSILSFTINPLPFWQDYMVQFSSSARTVPATFTYSEGIENLLDVDGKCATSTITVCEDPFIMPEADSGRNDFYFPDNIIIGKGQILNKDGTTFRQDFEIYTVVLDLPSEYRFDHAVLNVFEKLIKDNGNGKTNIGLPCAKFADCTTVKSDALLKNQIRFDAVIQSDGYTTETVFGLYMDQITGLLTVTVDNINYNAVWSEIRAKILITAYLKKGGWNNTPLTIPNTQVAGLFTSGVIAI